MPPVDLNRRYQAFACRCGHLWLERPRHVICADCGGAIGRIELADARAVAFYKHERDEQDRKRIAGLREKASR